MDEGMIRDAARALGRRLNDLLNEGMAPEIRLSCEEALLAQSFAERVADLLTKELSIQLVPPQTQLAVRAPGGTAVANRTSCKPLAGARSRLAPMQRLEFRPQAHSAQCVKTIG